MVSASRCSFFAITSLLCAFSIHSEEINLSGSVRNQSGKPVIGAKITLTGDTMIGATTDSVGKFTLSGQITSLRLRRSTVRFPAVSLRGQEIRVVLGNSSNLRMRVHTISGKTVYDRCWNELDPGSNFITLPVNGFGTGYYLITLEFEGKRSVFGYVQPGNRPESRVSSSDASDDDLAAVMKKAAKRRSQAAVDSLLIRAGGYKPSTYPILFYQRSDIDIVLERVSRLVNITRSCEGLMPGPVSGGQSGWGSRYWDCCKPHCSWPDKTTHYAANCGIDGTEEIDCFREVGNEYWTGLEGTKSGCEQDGEAFMCYRHVPFAVCEKLAYGFAAVPAGDDACGKCFQLDFDGGFRHGEPKQAHAMVKGKAMIVMASNIGHDVGGGQFDLMIPGGGLGAFRQGCARQWNVDVNDENIVGKGNGGFISKCQDKLGWDADPESLKECVRGMCDNLFGKDPSLNDLWEGCIWYVEWMHAVDNPTFTYKEVECPRELVELYYTSRHPRP